MYTFINLFFLKWLRELRSRDERVIIELGKINHSGALTKPF